MAQFGFYKENREKNRVQKAAAWIVDILAAAALAVFLVGMLLNPRTISGKSMEPGLMAGDRVLVSRFSADFLRIRRYEILEFEPGDGTTHTSFKRVVGLPGETVQIAEGKVLIDGEALTGGPLEGVTVTIAGVAEQPVTLGEDEYFVLGDNTGSSEDSRFANLGNVKGSQIVGRVWMRYAPAARFGPVR